MNKEAKISKGDNIYIVHYPYILTKEIEKVCVTYETDTEIINEYQIGTYAFFTYAEAEERLEEFKEWLKQ